MLHVPHLPPVHVTLPAAHAPSELNALAQDVVVPLMHWQPPGGLLGLPSQLLSLPTSQVSFVGGMLHAPQMPFAQAVIPVAQGPARPSATAQVDALPLVHLQPWLAIPSQVASLPESQVSRD
jgi:hypothetical protein